MCLALNKNVSQSWSAVSRVKKRINFNDKTASVNLCFPAVVLKWNVVSQHFGGRGPACWEGSECFLCVCFLAFLHPLSPLLDDSFWEPALDLLTNKADFYFNFIFIWRTHGTEEAEFLPAAVYFLKMLSWSGLSHISIWNSVVRFGMSLRAASEHVGIWWLLLQTQVWMMLWVRVCALLNFLNQIPYYGSQCSAFTLGCFEPSRILLFQSVAKHNLGVFWLGVICACVPQLPGSHVLGVLVPSLKVQFPRAFLQTSKEELGGNLEVLRFFLSSHSRKIWISKLWVWRGSWRRGVLPAALAVAGLGLHVREGCLAGAWQTASPHGFPCWRLAGHGDLLSSWREATQGLSCPWFSEAFCLASWHLTLG